MALTLLTGPANAAKAGVAFDRLRALGSHDPLLVVPTSADVEHYERELVGSGLVFSAEVVTFGRLIALFAGVTGLSGRLLGRASCERIVRAVIDEGALDSLSASARSPGFPDSVAELFAELQRSLVSPARLETALKAWARQGGGGRLSQAREAARLYGAYRERLASLDAHDVEGFTWAALDSLRRAPQAWNARPVVFYGFDDLTPSELDAVEVLVRRAEAEVLVALPYEPGRMAFAGRATTVELLRPLATEHIALSERSEHYAAVARPALHHLERHLFETDAPVESADGVVRLLEAGGERAEAELVAAHVLGLQRAGMRAEDIAVLTSGGPSAGDLLASVMEAYGIPVALERRSPLSRTRLGAGVLALGRIGVGEGAPHDLLRWLRTPGRLEEPAFADRFEAELRRTRTVSLEEAATRLAASSALGARLEAVSRAADEGPLAFLEALAAEAEDIWTGAHRRAAAVLDREQAVDARVAAAARATATELGRLWTDDPTLLPDSRAVLELLGGVPVAEREAQPGVLVAAPLEIRARRFRAVVATGLQEGEFPSRPAPDPFLDDDDRRSLAEASGVRLPLREDQLASERYLFYAVCSRPEQMLALAWRSSTEDGDPLQPSPFLDEVRRLFGPELWTERDRRMLAEVTWPVAQAPTSPELRRSLAAASRRPEPPSVSAPVTPAVLEMLSARRREAAGSLETFASCGVRWLVESLLRPQTIDPDPEPLWRGSLAHALMEETLRGLRERTGSARLCDDRLGAALAELRRSASRREEQMGGARERAALKSIEADLARYLRSECEHGAGLEPTLLEWTFGTESDESEDALVLSGGTRVSGRVDRVDTGGGAAVVHDYKNRAVHAAARWVPDRKLQAGLYALAVRTQLGLAPMAAVYQPLSGPDLRPRGIVRTGLPGPYVGSDVVDDESFEAALETVRELADEAAQGIRAGRIEACPSRCSARGCMYPGICRAGDADAGLGESDQLGGSE